MDKNMQAEALENEHCLPFLVHAPRRACLFSDTPRNHCTVLGKGSIAIFEIYCSAQKNSENLFSLTLN
jgi:hypothetical protein